MKRRTFMTLAASTLAATQLSKAAEPLKPATFLVAHGAWSAGWVWRKMHPLMRAAGHQLVTPSYTGIGERQHLANPSVDLEVHIQDLLGVIKCEQLSDIILVGHSYGGMVATGVADRVPGQIRKLVYLDAFVPTNGQSLFDLVTPAAAERMRAGANAGNGWLVPPNPIPPDTSPEDARWVQSLRMPQPIKTFETPLKLGNGDIRIPRTYVYCKRADPNDTFKPFAARAQRERWGYHELDASHSPHVTAPQALTALLHSIS